MRTQQMTPVEWIKKDRDHYLPGARMGDAYHYIIQTSNECLFVYECQLKPEIMREWCKYKGHTLIGWCDELNSYSDDLEYIRCDDNQILHWTLRKRAIEEHNAPIHARLKELNEQLPQPHILPLGYSGLMELLPGGKEEMQKQFKEQTDILTSQGYKYVGVWTGGHVFQHPDLDAVFETQRQEREELKSQIWNE